MQISRFQILLIFTLFAISHALVTSLVSFVLPEVLDELRQSKKMEDFIKHLGIPSVDLCQPSTDGNFNPMFNEDLAFGDLILNDKVEEDEDTDDTHHDFNSDKSSSSKKPNGRKSGDKKNKWTDGVVPYYISNDFSKSQTEVIEKAISAMNSKLSEVKFETFNRLSHKNYLYLFSGKGCYSKLGMKGGQQPVSLQADGCLTNGIVQHELMHAIGFCHEQNRPDRDSYIKVLQENIPEKWLNEYERNNPPDAAYVGEYDYLSVMHYPSDSPGDESKRAFEILDDTIDEEDVGNKNGLSDLDVQKIDEFYRESD